MLFSSRSSTLKRQRRLQGSCLAIQKLCNITHVIIIYLRLTILLFCKEFAIDFLTYRSSFLLQPWRYSFLYCIYLSRLSLVLQLKFFRGHEKLGKAVSPIVTKRILPIVTKGILNRWFRQAILAHLKICLNKPVLRKNLAPCVLPGAPSVKFKKRLLYPITPCLKLNIYV